ncbi:MAG: Na/Pi symporter, partial [Oceanidesulfovibrio sp.]
MTTAINLLGGLGLLLLGMKLMTDGFKLAGGPLLRDLLFKWTRTRLRGLVSGFGLTAVVQSSSAITVAAIGFVNAGLMTMPEAVWVVYGSNVGTTTTAWIVAFFGLKAKIKTLALVFVAVGTGLWISGTVSRRAALGEAL